MTEVSRNEFIKQVCNRLNISPVLTIETNGENLILSGVLRLKNAKITVFKDGNSIPLYVNVQTDKKYPTVKLNPDARIADKIICEVEKSISDINREIGGVVIKSRKCKIHGTGGWYEIGTKYLFKDIYCEV